MRTGTPHMRIFSHPCPFAYGVSPYAYGDRFWPVGRDAPESRTERSEGGERTTYYTRMHTGITTHPDMHMGIRVVSTTVCIRGFLQSQYAYGWFYRNHYLYGNFSVANHLYNVFVCIWEIRNSIPICESLHTGITTYCRTCFGEPRMQTGRDGQKFAYGESQ